MGDSVREWLIWYDSLYRYARGLSHDPASAQEMVQETYRRALAAKRAPSGQSDDVRRWLFTIARHIWHNELRDRQQELRNDRDWEYASRVNSDTPEQVLSRKLLQSEIRQAVDALPEPFREVLILRELESMSYAQIAAVLDCPPGTVMSRLARARSLLRLSLRRSDALKERPR